MGFANLQRSFLKPTSNTICCMHMRKVCEGFSISADSHLQFKALAGTGWPYRVVWMARFKAASEGQKKTGSNWHSDYYGYSPNPHARRIFHQLPSVTSCHGIVRSASFPGLALPRFTSQDGAALTSPQPTNHCINP